MESLKKGDMGEVVPANAMEIINGRVCQMHCSPKARIQEKGQEFMATGDRPITHANCCSKYTTAMAYLQSLHTQGRAGRWHMLHGMQCVVHPASIQGATHVRSKSLQVLQLSCETALETPHARTPTQLIQPSLF